VWSPSPGYRPDVPEPAEENVRIVITLPKSLRDAAEQAAQEDERSFAALVRYLLRQYLEQRRAERE
jgi:metal-responsive CopG/Arc/MetJ family transcriptional regulator